MLDDRQAADESALAEPSPLERGTGSVLGLSRVRPVPHADGQSARSALESVVLDGLIRPPCTVSFSGGRDSSAILAVAAHVARREGLPLPIPVSLVFPECESADEHEWQTTAINHLRLPDWQRLSFHDELDIVGPTAINVLREKGPLWPFNAFFHVPIMSASRGGSVLSGVFGDEMLTTGWAWHRENQVLQRRRSPLAADPVRIGVALGPKGVRGRFLRERRRRAGAGRQPIRPVWTRPEAFAAIVEAQDAITARETLSYRRSVLRTLWPLRSRIIGNRSMNSLATDHDVAYLAPFADARFVSALTTERGWRMFADRTAAVRWLVGDLLPSEIVERSSKAWFDRAFFNRHARAFAHVWSGRGVDPDFVDPEALRRCWLEQAEPDARTYILLQQAWLADNPS